MVRTSRMLPKMLPSWRGSICRRWSQDRARSGTQKVWSVVSYAVFEAGWDNGHGCHQDAAESVWQCMMKSYGLDSATSRLHDQGWTVGRGRLLGGH